MNRLILFEMIIFAFVIVGSLLGSLGLDRAGQVFLAVGIIDLIMSIAALRGWPMLRGDISNLAPLSKRDSGEAARDEYSMDHDRPSTGFAVEVTITGIVAIGIGIVLLLLFS
jgi:amino acid transporter